jgi:hypothetical protein
MMFIKLIYLTIVLAALLLAPISGGAAAAKSDIRRPGLTVDEGLSVARQYVETHRIDVSKHYVDSVKLDLNPRGDKGKRWVIIYELSNYAKGGQIIFHVYMDKSVERFFGE